MFQKKSLLLYLLLAFILMLSIGCSRNNENPVISNSPYLPSVNPDTNRSNRDLLGIWTLKFNPQSQNTESVPYRDIDFHLNVTPYLPAPAIHVVSFDQLSGILSVDITITNPTSINAYDLRLIVFTDNSGSRLMNPDNWTTQFDIPGGAAINPFRAYAKRVDKRLFAGHKSYTERLQLYFPAGLTSLNYAIDASFPSNCDEPYQISNFTQTPIYEGVGWFSDITVDVFDWQDNVYYVKLFCPAITGEASTSLRQSSAYTWEKRITNNTGAKAGKYNAYIQAISMNPNPVDLYDLITITVSPVTANSKYSSSIIFGLDYHCTNIVFSNDGFFYTIGPRHQKYIRIYKFRLDGNFVWGLNIENPSNSDNNGEEICLDSFGNVIVGGEYSGTVDFDPGPGVDIHTSNGPYHDIFVCKFDSDGNFKWARTWGGASNSEDDITCIRTDSSDNIHVSGYFKGLTDFDPGTGVFYLDAGTVYYPFLSKFSSDGTWLKAIKWSSSGGLTDQMIITPSNYLYVIGHASTGASLDKFATSNFNQVFYCAWIATGDESADGLDYDTNENIYVTGYFSGVMDLDPGIGVDEKTSNSLDSYLSKFDKFGNYKWGLSWEVGSSYNSGSVEIIESSHILIAGLGGHSQNCDFDPGPADFCPSFHGGIYISEFDTNGNFIWAWEFGQDCDFVSLNWDGQDILHIFGWFMDWIDFDPGPGEDEHSIGGWFISDYIVK